MSGAKYRITSPTLALFLEDGRHVARTIEEGTIVTVDCETSHDNKLVKVTWKNKDVMMFTQDLRFRAKALSGHNVAEPAGDCG